MRVDPDVVRIGSQALAAAPSRESILMRKMCRAIQPKTRGRRRLDGFVLDCQAAAAFLGITENLRARRRRPLAREAVR